VGVVTLAWDVGLQRSTRVCGYSTGDDFYIGKYRTPACEVLSNTYECTMDQELDDVAVYAPGDVACALTR